MQRKIIIILLSLLSLNIFAKPLLKYSSDKVIIILHANELNFYEENNNCISKISLELSFYNDKDFKIYEIKDYKTLQLNENNNIPDEEEIFIINYKVSLPPGTYKVICVISNKDELLFSRRIVRIVSHKMEISFNPYKYSLPYALTEVPVYNYRDKLALKYFSGINSDVVSILFLFNEKEKYIELASYTWFIKKEKIFTIPLNIFSEGRYTLLVVEENKQKILLKYDFMLFDTTKYRMIKDFYFWNNINNLYSKYLGERIYKKPPENLLTKILYADSLELSLTSFFNTFVDSLEVVGEKSGSKLFKLKNRNLYFIAKYDNIWFP